MRSRPEAGGSRIEVEGNGSKAGRKVMKNVFEDD